MKASSVLSGIHNKQVQQQVQENTEETMMIMEEQEKETKMELPKTEVELSKEQELPSTTVSIPSQKILEASNHVAVTDEAHTFKISSEVEAVIDENIEDIECTPLHPVNAGSQYLFPKHSQGFTPSPHLLAWNELSGIVVTTCADGTMLVLENVLDGTVEHVSLGSVFDSCRAPISAKRVNISPNGRFIIVEIDNTTSIFLFDILTGARHFLELPVGHRRQWVKVQEKVNGELILMVLSFIPQSFEYKMTVYGITTEEDTETIDPFKISERSFKTTLPESRQMIQEKLYTVTKMDFCGLRSPVVDEGSSLIFALNEHGDLFGCVLTSDLNVYGFNVDIDCSAFGKDSDTLMELFPALAKIGRKDFLQTASTYIRTVQTFALRQLSPTQNLDSLSDFTLLTKHPVGSEHEDAGHVLIWRIDHPSALPNFPSMGPSFVQHLIHSSTLKIRCCHVVKCVIPPAVLENISTEEQRRSLLINWKRDMVIFNSANTIYGAEMSQTTVPISLSKTKTLKSKSKTQTNKDDLSKEEWSMVLKLQHSFDSFAIAMCFTTAGNCGIVLLKDGSLHLLTHNRNSIVTNMPSGNENVIPATSVCLQQGSQLNDENILVSQSCNTITATSTSGSLMASYEPSVDCLSLWSQTNEWRQCLRVPAFVSSGRETYPNVKSISIISLDEFDMSAFDISTKKGLVINEPDGIIICSLDDGSVVIRSFANLMRSCADDDMWPGVETPRFAPALCSCVQLCFPTEFATAIHLTDDHRALIFGFSDGSLFSVGLNGFITHQFVTKSSPSVQLLSSPHHFKIHRILSLRSGLAIVSKDVLSFWKSMLGSSENKAQVRLMRSIAPGQLRVDQFHNACTSVSDDSALNLLTSLRDGRLLLSSVSYRPDLIAEAQVGRVVHTDLHTLGPWSDAIRSQDMRFTGENNVMICMDSMRSVMTDSEYKEDVWIQVVTKSSEMTMRHPINIIHLPNSLTSQQDGTSQNDSAAVSLLPPSYNFGKLNDNTCVLSCQRSTVICSNGIDEE
eukprot:TRINITY_DN392699_c0_g1_i3.p1 TRINITY_DN392699_c0_g1~~TRINITY_DN392699_c0_g1_i3.p1  ORF type:complete len:1018 (-),score=281.12 TRINITY_DN392699_c0_g1_i3:178-3231(-)